MMALGMLSCTKEKLDNKCGSIVSNRLTQKSRFAEDFYGNRVTITDRVIYVVIKLNNGDQEVEAWKGTQLYNSNGSTIGDPLPPDWQNRYKVGNTFCKP